MRSRLPVIHWLFVTALLCVAPQAAPAAEYSVELLREELAADYDLDQAFYKKVTQVEGILIATSERVSDLAHLEAAYQFGMVMQRISKPVAERIREQKVLCILIAHDELTSQLPSITGEAAGF
jgi:hypothetical protein